MAKKYLAPDFDVTSYEIKDVITANIMDGDPDSGEFGDVDPSWGEMEI